MWNKTNEYNAPVNQMARYKEAGLNPNLIYGQTGGGSSSASMASQPNQHEADFSGFMNATQSYIAYRKQQTEIDNMKSAREQMEADTTYKNAQTASVLQSTARSRFDLEQAQELKDTVIAQAKMNLSNSTLTGQKLAQEIESEIARTGNIKQNTAESRARVSKISQDILESADRLKTAQLMRDEKKIDIAIKDIHLGMWRAGINPNSSTGQRIIGRIMDESGLTDTVVEGVKSLGDGSWFKDRVKKAMKFFTENNNVFNPY